MKKSWLSPRPPAPAGEGNGKTAVKKWVGWEEQVCLDWSGSQVVCYYLRYASPRDGGSEIEKYPAVVGKFWGVGNMLYSAHGQFLRSIQAVAARSPRPSRAVRVAVEATQLRWKSRREIMDWLTSLVADSPYRTPGSGETSDGCSLGDQDGGSTAFKDGSSALAGNNSEGFAWIGPLPHLDRCRKHYRSFCRSGMRISVHDFIYIKSDDGTESNLAYVEDMYEDGGAHNMVLARWLDKPGDDHGVAMPPDVHDREVFFSYVLQDIGVNWVEGLAPVLNYQHFEWFQKREEEHSKWKPHLCHRQIVGTTLEPFNIAQLQGYANQEIVRTFFVASSSMAVRSKEPNKDKADGVQKRKHDEISEGKLVENPAALGKVAGDQAVETHTSLIVTNTVQKLPQCNATNDQTVAKDASKNIAISGQTMRSTNTVQKLPRCNPTNGQTVAKDAPKNIAISGQTMRSTKIVQKLSQCNATNGQTVAKDAPKNVAISGQTVRSTNTVQKLPQCNATNGQTVAKAVKTHTALIVTNTVQKLPQRNATNDQNVLKDAPENVAISGQTVRSTNTMQKLPQCNATNGHTVAKAATENVAISDQTVPKFPPCNATNHQTVWNLPPCNSTNHQTGRNLPPCNARNDQTVQKLPPQNVISQQTSQNNTPVNAPKTETVGNGPPRNAADVQAVVNLHPSGGSASGSGLPGSIMKLNSEDLFQTGCRVEALSQDSGIRGCWFRGVIVKRKRRSGFIRVKYTDIPNATGTGHLKEWLPLKRTADPDRLGIRLTGRPMIRPWPSNLANIPSPVTAGTLVDVQLKDGWWEGIVLEPKTVGRVRVYFPGERKIGEFVESDLRRSFEWAGDKWMTLMARPDVAARLPPSDVLANEGRPKPEMQKTASMLSNMGGNLVLQRIKGETSAKPVPPVAILEPMQVDGISSKPAAQNTSSQQSSQKGKGVSAELEAPRLTPQSREKVEDEPAKPAPQKTIFHCTTEELRLQSSKKGPDGESAKPAAEKVSLQYCQGGDDISFTDGVAPDTKRPRVDLTNFLKSENVLKWAERKARGSGPLMGYSDGSSQEDIADSAPNGDTAPVNSVPIKEGYRTNKEAPVSTAPLMIDQSDVE